MKITIWGSRGSIPSPGQDTLKYGGNSTCLELRPANGGIIIIDAGSGIRLLGKKLIKEAKSDQIFLLLTHAHWDHLSGFPFFMPAYSNKFKINVIGGPKAQRSIKRYLSQQMNPPFFPIDMSLMNAEFKFGKEAPDISSVGSVKVSSIPLIHPNGGYGYKFHEECKTFVFLTDNEIGFAHSNSLQYQKYVDFCKGADLLIHDAQYTDEEYKITKGWGHSTYNDALKLALDAEVKQFGIFHHDPDRTDADLDQQVDKCNEFIAQAKSNLICFASKEKQEIEV
ncbi:MBL fold metallo-hydrolase [candidate division KSB1 bacterium]